MAGVLYLVPTPIGNLGDISPRMAETLAQVDFIAAEDTRITLKLLNHLDIKKQLVSYYRHNTETSGDKIIQRILCGENCALVTDAGMPAISDPGEELVAECYKEGIQVIPIPGPCALVCALAASGQLTGRFTFEGFLPMKKKNRVEQLSSLADEQRTMIFYEAPHKLKNTLEDLCEVFGDSRFLTLCRELTKLHEEFLKMTLAEAVEYYRDREPRGEYVLVVAGAERKAEAEYSLEDGLAFVERLIKSGKSKKDAVKQAAKEMGLSKNDLYTLCIEKLTE